jgi:hypothetical protein
MASRSGFMISSPMRCEPVKRRLSDKAKQYCDKAAECDWMASRAKDLAVKTSLAEVAAQWRHLANQVEHLERERHELPPHSK